MKRYQITLTDEVAKKVEEEARKMFGKRRGYKAMFIEFVLRRFFNMPSEVER